MPGTRKGTLTCPGWTPENDAAALKARGSPYMKPEGSGLIYKTIWNAPCGCTVRGYGNIPDPIRPMLCPVHASAPALRDALEGLVKKCYCQDADANGENCPVCKDARKALALAAGGAK